MKRSFFRTFIVLMAATILVVAAASVSFAATSAKKITYKGSGKVNVTFSAKVTYEDVAIAVKDNTGKSYKTSIKSQSGTAITFLINSYKAGKTYKITISGIKAGPVTGTFKIYSKSRAINIAKSMAKKPPWEASGFQNIKAISGTSNNLSAWKVSFTDSKGRNFVYFVSQQTGKVIQGGLKK